ncbi:Gfo/Idh/MocA family protein [Lewinella sp. JB7]|uniref:Gfo/Idh/MocA family protein n=1 Tax=Lewinella sp. JB7 TaxID=2962887 RepID=UPI0020C9C93A|nr:Gfo/Idh/MocA family oxidoreductase [Lewinella sp. JB7]MCP9236785.1 Gfo/Idh/MocA family oxidoreductase [Lewinella sp. JB7]
MNFLIVGGGSIGKRHLRNLQILGYQNIWVLRRKHDSAFELEHQVVIVTSFTEAAKIEFAAVFVCTPTSLHNEGIEFAVNNGAAIFVEKPLIHSRQALAETHSILTSGPVTFFIGFMLRFHPLVRRINEVLQSGSLGKVYSARFSFGSYLPYWHPWEDYRDSYASRRELGGGVINTITHELDLIQYLFGEPVSVYCEVGNTGMLGIEVEEQCEAIFSYPDKLITLHLDYLQKDYDRNIIILCEEGKLTWDWHANEINLKQHRSEDQVIATPVDFEVNHLYINELRTFLDLVGKGSVSHDLDFDHAVRNTELMLLMHESGVQGKKLRNE